MPTTLTKETVTEAKLKQPLNTKPTKPKGHLKGQRGYHQTE